MKEFICKVCNGKYTSSINLANHTKLVHEKKKIRCNKCRAKFSSFELMFNHKCQPKLPDETTKSYKTPEKLNLPEETKKPENNTKLEEDNKNRYLCHFCSTVYFESESKIIEHINNVHVNGSKPKSPERPPSPTTSEKDKKRRSELCMEDNEKKVRLKEEEWQQNQNFDKFYIFHQKKNNPENEQTTEDIFENDSCPSNNSTKQSTIVSANEIIKSKTSLTSSEIVENYPQIPSTSKAHRYTCVTFYGCIQCPSNFFTTRKSARQHYVEFHCYSDDRIFDLNVMLVYKCNVCEVYFSAIYLVQNHKCQGQSKLPEINMSAIIEKVIKKSMNSSQQIELNKIPIEYECHFCFKHFPKLEIIRHHVESVHLLEKAQIIEFPVSDKYCLYKCLKCSIPQPSFRNEYDLIKHIMSKFHTQNNICSDCSESFENDDQLLNHIIQQHKPNPIVYQIFRCGQKRCGAKQFDSIIMAELHSRVHQGVNEIRCNSCPKIFYDLKTLMDHRYKVHGKTKYNDEFECYFCEFSNLFRCQVVKHIMDVHSCRKLSSKDSNIKKDILAPCKDDSNSPTKFVFPSKPLHIGMTKCTFCQTNILGHEEMQKHIYNVHFGEDETRINPERVTSLCPFCTGSFSNNEAAFRTHIMTMHYNVYFYLLNNVRMQSITQNDHQQSYGENNHNTDCLQHLQPTTTNLNDNANIFTLNPDQIQSVCDALLKQGDVKKLAEFLRSLPTNELLSGNEGILLASAQLAYDQGMLRELFVILESHFFSPKYRPKLRDLWYTGHYKEAEHVRNRPLDPMGKHRLRKRYPLPKTIWNEKEICFNDKIRKTLNDCTENFYLTPVEEKALIKTTGLTLRQVRQWYHFRRPRQEPISSNKTAEMLEETSR